MAKITIITVNLNNISGLQNTVESVLGQTYLDKEYIIIDGGSVDGSQDLIKKYANQLTYWLSEPDFGIYDAMNKGIKLSSGEWVIFMNSGDKFYDYNILEVIFNKKFFNEPDIIYGKTQLKNSEIIVDVPDKIIKRYFFKNTICHQSVFTSRDSFNKIGNYNLEYKLISDREWFLRAKISNLNFHFENKIISIWDPEGFSKNNASLLLKEINMMRKIYFSVIENVLFWLITKLSSFYNLFRKLS